MAYSDPLIGKTLANYRLDRLLGRGGMARVYFGWDLRLHRPVAIKVMDERYRDNPAYTARFVREARAVAAWNHPNISKVFYAGEEEGWPFFVMEYVRGLDLQQLLKQYTSAGELISYSDVLRIGRAMAAALDYAHQKGVIHRDVKPSNVIVSDDGRVVLTDFGLAMNVAHGTLGEVFGSPHYMAPEQARNSAQAVPQSDLYSLGVMLYEMLTGVLPFDDPSPTSLALKQLTQDPPPPRQVNPALSPQVESVLLKALSKEPHQRYQTGRELMKALEQALEMPEEHSQPVTLPYIIGRETAAGVGSKGGAGPTLSRVEMTQKINDYLSGQSTARSPGGSGGAPPTYGGPVNVYPAAGPAIPAGAARRWALGCFILLLIGSLTGGLALGYFYNRQRLRGPLAGLPSFQQTATANAAATAGETPPTVEASPTGASSETPTQESPTSGTPTETATITATPTQTLTPEPTSTHTPTPTFTPSPTLDPNARFSLWFVRLNENLYILNVWTEDFPLERLELRRNERERIEGREWELEVLEAGECVVAEQSPKGEKDGGPARNIVINVNGRSCDPTGEQVTRRGNNRFWNKTFEIYFDGELVGRCEEKERICELVF